MTLLWISVVTGVERLAGMTLKDPVKIDIAAIESKSDDTKSKAKLSLSSGSVVDSTVKETFATPDSLKHHYAVVPSKLRLVTLASFILWKCKVSVLYEAFEAPGWIK